MGPASPQRRDLIFSSDFPMMRFFSLFLLLLFFLATPARAESGVKILLVVGTGGTEEYEVIFKETAAYWIEAAKKGEAAIEIIGLEDGEADDDAKRVQEAIAAEKSSELWVVLIGHGTYDGRVVKFNVSGPDFTDEELADWLGDFKGDLTIINTASASGSYIRQMAKPGRVVITATKNEAEISFTRFGRVFAEAVGGLIDADLDNDQQVSLLESFLHASNRVALFYKDDARLATEHALIDDNGDQLGSRAEWFEGTTPTQTPSAEAKPDGDLAAQKVLVKNAFEKRLTPEQVKNRDDVERQVVALRRSKSSLDEADYYAKLEALLLELARIYDAVGDS
jgi:hypothetical protein